MISIGIQAGGRSTRMGRDKALLPFQGTFLLDWTASRIAHLTDDLLVISINPELVSRISYPVFPDLVQGRGPLGGLQAALQYAKYEVVACVACDMPFVNPLLLAEEAHLLDELGVDVVIPEVGGQLEPLHAVYRKSTCLPEIESTLMSGKSRLIDWHHAVKVHPMPEEVIRQFDPGRLAFFNINTPEDLREAELKINS